MQDATYGQDRPDALIWRIAPFVFLMFWAGGYSFAKLGLAHIEPMTMLAVRYGLAIIALLPLLLVRRPAWPRSARHWAAIAFTGFLIQCVYFGLAYLAMKRGMNAGTTAIIMALQPILVAVASPLISGTRLTSLLWVGLALGFAGVIVVILSGGALGPSPWAAVLLAFGALSGITLATLFEKWHGMRSDPVVGGLIQYVVGFAVLLPVAWSTETMVIDWQPELVIALAYLVIANSIISVGLYIALLQRGDATRISAMMYLVPPLAMIIAWALLGEKVTTMALGGFALSALGVYMVGRQTGKG